MIVPQYKPLDWVKATNIYEINLRQYTAEGTFNAFARELPRLRDMGVETLWFMPIHPIGTLGRKGTLGSYYSVQNYTDTNPEYGTVKDFKTLVRIAQQLDFKVIIDWVANHSSNDNMWIHEHPDFYVQDENGVIQHPYDWDDVSALNYDSAGLRTTMIEAMKFWVETCGIDGFRCDMAHLVRLDFWEQARASLEKIKPLFWLAETEEVSYHKIFDASYTWEWMHKTEDYCKGWTDMAGLSYILNKYNYSFPAAASRLFYTSNHDENSHTGTEYDKFGAAARALAVFSCTWSGIPLIYSGQELPNRKKLAFFEKDTIEWNGTYELHDFYKTLLSLHKNSKALHAGNTVFTTYRVRTNADNNVLAYLRKDNANEVLVLLNLSSDFVHLEIQDEQVAGNFINVFTKDINDFNVQISFEMQAGDYLVFEKK